jgi:hypothetical protein
MKERLMEQIDREDRTSRTTFRLAIGAAAAVLLVAAGLGAVLLQGDEPEVQNPGGPDTSGDPGNPGTKSVDTTIREWDFAHRTYTRPCPSIQEALDVPVTDVRMKPGGAELGADDMVAELVDVTYADLDRDGDDDALALIWCHSATEVGGPGAVWAGAYRENGDRDDVELIGDPLVVPYVEGEATVYDAPDAADRVVAVSRSATRTDTWEFDGSKFVESEGASATGIRDVDFENRTYPKPCPSIKDADITFDHGSAALGDESFRYVAELEVGAYGDFDGDGEDDALVVIFCHHQAAESAAAWAAVYTLGGDGEPVPVGTPLELPDGTPHPYELPAVDGATVTVKMDPDPEQVWVFEHDGFVRQPGR